LQLMVYIVGFRVAVTHARCYNVVAAHWSKRKLGLAIHLHFVAMTCIQAMETNLPW